jgi:hypothetical protein
MEVEAGADVGDDKVGGVAGSEVLDLALEVLLLVGGADPGVDDLLLFRPEVIAVFSEELEDVISEVEALAGDPSLFRPLPEARVGDVIALSNVL